MVQSNHHTCTGAYLVVRGDAEGESPTH